MMRFKKVYNLKIIAMVVALVFSLNAMVYGIGLSREIHLRPPMMFEEDKKLTDAEPEADEESTVSNEVLSRRRFLKVMGAVGLGITAIGGGLLFVKRSPSIPEEFLQAVSVFHKDIQELIITRNDIRKLTKEEVFENLKEYIFPALLSLNIAKQKIILENIRLVDETDETHPFSLDRTRRIFEDVCFLAGKLDASLLEEFFPVRIYRYMRYRSMIGLLDLVPLNNTSIRKYLDHIDKLSQKPRGADKERTIGVFQGALYFFTMAYRNLLIKPELADSLLQDLFRREGIPGYEEWLIERVIPLLKDELSAWGIALPEDAETWQDVAIRCVVGVTFEDSYYVPSAVEVDRVNIILDSQNIDRTDSYEFLIGLAYAANMRYFSQDILSIVHTDIVKRHRLYTPLTLPFEGGMFVGGEVGLIPEDGRPYIAGSLFSLPSELSHYYEFLLLQNDERRIAGLEIADRLGVLMMLKQVPFLTYDESAEYIYYVYKLGEEILNTKEMIEDVLNSMKGTISNDRLQKIRNDYSLVSEELTPSEVYYLGDMYKDREVSFNSSNKSKIHEINERLRISGIKRANFEKEMANAIGIYASSTKNIGFKLTHALLDPYEEYKGSHAFSERISLDFSIKVAVSCVAAGVPTKIQPYLFSKAFRFVIKNVIQEHPRDRRTVIDTIMQISPRHIEAWLDELINEGIVRIGTPLPTRERKGIEEIYREHTIIGNIAALGPLRSSL